MGRSHNRKLADFDKLYCAYFGDMSDMESHVGALDLDELTELIRDISVSYTHLTLPTIPLV